MPSLVPVAFRSGDGDVPLYFEAAAVITVLVLLGQILEMRARRRTSGAMASGTIRTVIPIASAMRSMDDKRGSRLPLSISDKCCGRIGN